MKIYIILVFTIILSFSTNAQWTEITADTTYYNNSAFFFNSDTGVVVSFQGIIQKTHDGGLTWDTTFNFNLFNSGII